MKRFTFLLCSAVIVCIITACDTKEQKEQNKINLKIAQEHVSDYISDKYGFDAEIISADVIRHESMWGVHSENRVLLTLEHEGREFEVKATIEPFRDDYENNIIYTDDYQFKEVEDAFAGYIGSHMSGLKRFTLVHMYFDKYYDGGDVMEYLKDGSVINFYAYYIDRNLADISQFSFLDELDDKFTFMYRFISCRSDEAVKRASDLSFDYTYQLREYAKDIKEVRIGLHNPQGHFDENYESYAYPNYYISTTLK